METKMSSKSSNHKSCKNMNKTQKNKTLLDCQNMLNNVKKIQSKILKKFLLAFSQICAHILFALFDGM